MTRALGVTAVAVLILLPPSGIAGGTRPSATQASDVGRGLQTPPSEQTNQPSATQSRGVRELAQDLAASDALVRARAACALRDLGDAAADAIQPLVAMLGDAAPVEASICDRRWWRGDGNDLTSPGEQAAAALVAIGTRSFQPLMETLRSTTWTARWNSAWALGALDDRRAAPALVEALKDREPGVREQAAWALGAIDDARAVSALSAALSDADDRTREQAAWALGAIDDNTAVPALVRALSDTSPRVRKQAAWALGAIGDAQALHSLLPSLKDPDAGVRKQAAWAIGVIGK